MSKCDKGINYDVPKTKKQFIRKTVLPYIWYQLEHNHGWTGGNKGLRRWDIDWSDTCEGFAEIIRQAAELGCTVDWNDIDMSHLIGDPSWFDQAIMRIGIDHIQEVPNLIERESMRRKIIRDNCSVFGNESK